MDKEVRKILGANDRLTCGKKRTSPLDPILTKPGGGGGGGGGAGGEGEERGEQTKKIEKEIGFLKRETPTSLKIFR